MNIKSIILFFSLFIISSLAFAKQNNIQFVPEFVGGLNVSQINACENKYAKICPHASQFSSCIEKQMAKDKSCIQALKIRQLTAPATEMRKYGKITVFYTTSLGDDIDTYYMVDTKGNLISLDTNLNLNSNKDYLLLKQKYPNTILTDFLYWTKANEDLFPKSQMLGNKDQQLIFRQDLQDGECVACKKIGVADIAYEFNQKGGFIRSKLLKITAVN